MATVSRRLGGFGDASIYLLYDDVTLYVTGIRVDNPTDNTVWGTATDDSTGRTASHTWLAQTDETINIPTNAAARLQLVVNANGRLDGVTYRFMSPGP